MPNDNNSLNISSIKRIARGRLKGNWKTAFIPAFIITLMTGIPALFDSVIRSAAWANLMLDDSWMNSSDPAALMEAISNMQITGPASWVNTLLSLFSFLCSGALAVSMATLSLQIIRREPYTASTAFSGFSQFARAFIISLLIMIFSFLWGMITILPALVVFAVGLSLGSAFMAILGTIILITAFIGYILIILRYSMAYFIASDDRVIPASHVTANSVFLMRRRTGNFFLLELSFIGWLILASLPLSIGVVLMMSGYLQGIGGLILIGAVLSAAAMIPLAFVSLYISTSEAVYYSTISGHYNVNVPAGQAAPAAQPNPDAQAALTAEHKDFPEELASPDPYSADPDNVREPAAPTPEPAASPAEEAEPAAPDPVPSESSAHAYFPDSLSSDNPYDPDPKESSNAGRE